MRAVTSPAFPCHHTTSVMRRLARRASRHLKDKASVARGPSRRMSSRPPHPFHAPSRGSHQAWHSQQHIDLHWTADVLLLRLRGWPIVCFLQAPLVSVSCSVMVGLSPTCSAPCRAHLKSSLWGLSIILACVLRGDERMKCPSSRTNLLDTKSLCQQNLARMYVRNASPERFRCQLIS